MSENEEKLKKLSQRFQLAEQAVQQMEETFDDLDSLQIIEVGEPGQHLPAIPAKNEVFSIETLRSDFNMLRSNALTIIQRGQSIVEMASSLDAGDLKASQLEALASLQNALGSNMKLLTSIYKDIMSIEAAKANLDLRMNPINPAVPGSMQVTGNVTQNIVLTGTTTDLIRMRKEPKDITPDGTES